MSNLLATTNPSYRDVLRLPSVAPLFASATLSRLAGEMFTLAVILHVLDRFESPAVTGWVVAAASLPGFLVSPIAGALLDRFGPARGIMIDLASSTVLIAVIALTDVRGTGGAALLVALAAGYSLARPLSLAGFRSLLPRLVPADARDRANGLDISTFSIVEVIGPAVAGLLFATVGGRATMLVVAVLYAGSSLALLPVLRRRITGTGGNGSLLAEAVGSLGYVLRHATLRGLALGYSLYQLAWGVLVVAVPVALVGRSGADEGGSVSVGLLWAMLGVVGGISGLITGKLGLRGRERTFIAAGILVTAVASYPVIGHGGTAGLIVGLVIIGLVSGPVNVGLLSLRQRRTDPDRLGRVIAVSISLNLMGGPIGAALGGWLGGHSVPLAFGAGAGAAVLGAVVCLLLIPATVRPRSAIAEVGGTHRPQNGPLSPTSRK